jgi:hypothetical protein
MCFVYKNRVDKLDCSSTKAICLGYSTQKKGYKCYDPKKNKLHISRNIVFFEEDPYYRINEEDHNVLSPLNEYLLPLTTNQERQYSCDRK